MPALLLTLFISWALAQSTNVESTTPAVKSSPNVSPPRGANSPDSVIAALNPMADRIHGKKLLKLSEAFHAKKDYENEIRILKLMLIDDDKNFRNIYRMALAQLELKKDVEAVASLRKCLSIDPRFKPGAETLLQYFLKNNSRYEAREILADLIAKYGNKPEYQNDLCQLYADDGFTKEAITECKKAIELSRQYPDNYVYLAQSLSDSDLAKDAEKILVSAATRFPTSELVQVSTAQLFFKRNLYSVSAKYFAKAIKVNPNSVKALVGFAQSELQNNHLDVSYNTFYKACQINEKTVRDFQEATATLRQKGDETWVRKFNQGTFACSVKHHN